MARTVAFSRRAFLTGTPRSSAGLQATPGAADARIAAISDECLARAGVYCMICRDACAEQAVRFRPRVGGAFLPEVIKDLCSGCGACIALCPTRAVTLTDWSGEAGDA
jgi:ferredoxin-type protein NapF